jgi:hypothetical protein
MIDSGQQMLEKVFPGIVNVISPGTLPEDEDTKRTWQIAKWIMIWGSIVFLILVIILELLFPK